MKDKHYLKWKKTFKKLISKISMKNKSLFSEEKKIICIIILNFAKIININNFDCMKARPFMTYHCQSVQH